APAVKAFHGIPPLRTGNQPDAQDSARVAWVTGLWDSQTLALRQRDRQIEENVRMLCGQQYCVFSPLAGRFIDALDLLPEQERRWRQRPTFNRLIYWYILTHSRLTENPPILGFLPGTGDRLSADLAEVMDPIFKSLWHDAEMPEVFDRLVAWLIPGGGAYAKSRLDLTVGDVREWREDAVLQLLDGEGSPVSGPDGVPVESMVRGVPFDRDGQPLARLVGDGSEYEVTGDPYVERDGSIRVDVVPMPNVRSEWSDRPFHERAWHIQQSFLTPAEVYDTYGLDVQPNVTGGQAAGIAEIRRLLHGSGFFGANSGLVDSQVSEAHGEFVRVLELWHKPSRFPGMEDNHGRTPGGRLLTICGNQVARDGARPFQLRSASPLRYFSFINVPGRPGGTTPQEAMNPVQRSYNRMYGMIMEHTALLTNPKALIDATSGIEEGQWSNAPGEALVVNKVPGIQPVEYVAPPSLGQDVYRLHGMLAQELTDMGHLEGAEGAAPTANASGELVEKLRFNSDRFLGATVRRFPVEFARMAYDWMAMVKVSWTREKVITWAGADQVTRTILVYPELFQQGSVNVIPDTDSMLPEGRESRQLRVRDLYDRGAFGPVGSPEALAAYVEQMRFPHLGRDLRPGGPHRTTAEVFLGKLVQGEKAAALPLYPWYNCQVHSMVLESFMAGPDFLRLSPEIQTELFIRWQMVSARAQEQQMMLQAQAQAAAALTQPAGKPAGGAPPSAAPGEPGPAARAA
ncbi:MAG TPA: hypothetical protein VGB66_04355, partial [Longimicrobium sp.]